MDIRLQLIDVCNPHFALLFLYVRFRPCESLGKNEAGKKSRDFAPSVSLSPASQLLHQMILNKEIKVLLLVFG